MLKRISHIIQSMCFISYLFGFPGVVTFPNWGLLFIILKSKDIFSGQTQVRDGLRRAPLTSSELNSKMGFADPLISCTALFVHSKEAISSLIWCLSSKLDCGIIPVRKMSKQTQMPLFLSIQWYLSSFHQCIFFFFVLPDRAQWCTKHDKSVAYFIHLGKTITQLDHI